MPYYKHKDGTYHYHNYSYNDGDMRISRILRRAIVNGITRNHYAHSTTSTTGTHMSLANKNNVSSKRMGEHEKKEPTFSAPTKSIAKTKAASNVSPSLKPNVAPKAAPVAAPKAASTPVKKPMSRLRVAMNDNQKKVPTAKPTTSPSSKPTPILPPRYIHPPKPKAASTTPPKPTAPVGNTAPKAKPAAILPPRVMGAPKVKPTTPSQTTPPTDAPKKSIVKTKSLAKAPKAVSPAAPKATTGVKKKAAPKKVAVA